MRFKEELSRIDLHLRPAASLDLLLRVWFDLDALSEEHGVHAGLGVSSGGVQQQVRQLWRHKSRRVSEAFQMVIPSSNVHSESHNRVLKSTPSPVHHARRRDKPST